MSEGLSASEVGKEIAAHHQHHADRTGEHRVVTIVEAVLLAVVALLAAWSGYAAAKWSTESRLHLAESASARAKSSQADLEAMETRNLDAMMFDTWKKFGLASEKPITRTMRLAKARSFCCAAPRRACRSPALISVTLIPPPSPRVESPVP